jgi:hypothetical protein
VAVRIERLAGGVERLDVVLEQCREQTALRELDAAVELDEPLLRGLRVGRGRGVRCGLALGCERGLGD